MGRSYRLAILLGIAGILFSWAPSAGALEIMKPQGSVKTVPSQGQLKTPQKTTRTLADSAKRSYCTKFAAEAMGRYREGLKYKCKIVRNFLWHGDSKRLFSWCMRVDQRTSKNEAQIMTQQRNNCIDNYQHLRRTCTIWARKVAGIRRDQEKKHPWCESPLLPKGDWRTYFKVCLEIGLSASKREARTRDILRFVQNCKDREQKCQRYTKTSMAQIRENQRLKCGYSGGNWLLNSSWHMRFCLQNPPTAFAAENKREAKLAECRKRMSDQCYIYATSAVKQQERNLAWGCGFGGWDWHAVFKEHYDWCKKTGSRTAARKQHWRIAELKKCDAKRKASAPKENFCKRYASLAVTANIENVGTEGCKYFGAAWHGDYKGHYNWCMGATYKDAYAESKKRAEMLKKCGVSIQSAP